MFYRSERHFSHFQLYYLARLSAVSVLSQVSGTLLLNVFIIIIIRSAWVRSQVCCFNLRCSVLMESPTTFMSVLLQILYLLAYGTERSAR